MARHLLDNSEETIIFNIRGRTFSHNVNVLKRLAKKRGLFYLTDLLLGRRFRKYYQNPAVRIFPDIKEDVIAEVKKRCQHYDIDDPHSKRTIELVKNISPDYILFLGAPVIKPSFYSLSKYGTINWHHGLSPLYKGSDCVIWAMSRNDFNNIGFTIHYVSDVVDGGKIIMQRKVPVRKDLEFSEVLADILRQGIKGFIEVVNSILSEKELNTIEQEKGGVHYPPAGLSTIRQAYKNYRKYSVG